jgi:hypothetical protein
MVHDQIQTASTLYLNEIKNPLRHEEDYINSIYQLSQVMKHFLNVFILFQFIHQLQYIFSLFF